MVFRGELDAVDELHARPRVVAQEEVAVEIDVVAQARDLRSGGDREPRLVHAAEHDAETERAGHVRDADRLADPARFRELDVHAVSAVRAGWNIRGDMAVLVD